MDALITPCCSAALLLFSLTRKHSIESLTQDTQYRHGSVDYVRYMNIFVHSDIHVHVIVSQYLIHVLEFQAGHHLISNGEGGHKHP